MKKGKPSGEKLLIETCEEVFRDRIVVIEQIGFSNKSNPPKMGQSMDVFRPVFNGLKRYLQDGIQLNACVKVIDDTKYVVVLERHAVDIQFLFIISE